MCLLEGTNLVLQLWEPLAMHLTSCPHARVDEQITQRNILYNSKLMAEGTPAEIQIVLGWLLNTQELLVSLPADKYIAWTSELQLMTNAGHTTFGDLDTSIGHLSHASQVISLARHFLNQLAFESKISAPNHRRSLSHRMKSMTSTSGLPSSPKHMGAS